MSRAPATPEAPGRDWPEEVHQIFRRMAVRQVAHVPDAGLARLIELCAGDAGMRAITLTREDEGVGLLLGAWLGGQRGALLMQSSGVGNIVNALSLVRVCRFPLLVLVTMRGEWGEFNPWQVPMGQATRRVLEAQGMIVEDATDPAEVGPTVEAAAKLAFDGQQGVAVTIAQRVIGTKEFKD